jgi:membrane-associated phospholipid phosphatase
MSEPHDEILSNHRRAMVYSVLLFAATALILLAVGRHPGEPGTTTTWPPIGRFDGEIWTAIQGQRSDLSTWIARALNVLGGGIVTIPLRALVALYLAYRRRWHAAALWVVTWIAAEVLLTLGKLWYMRMRPPDPLVETVGFSFPSGHAVAAASIAVALVLVSMPAGRRRRKWEMLAAAAAFLMAFSRVYLNAHWFSDVTAGVLLGTAVALGSAALVTEVRDLIVRREATA